MRESSADYLLAAWYYLDGRHQVLSRLASGTLAPEDPHLTSLLEVGEKLLDRLRNVRAPDRNRLVLEVSRAVADLTAKVRPR